jgi:cupredoxin-like protein
MKALLLASGLALLLTRVAIADEVPEYLLLIKDHRYQPDVLKVPADTKVRILVRNEDATPEEFESSEFNREKLVPPGGSVTVYVGPLRAGTYRFFGDFNQATAQGRLIVE